MGRAPSARFSLLSQARAFSSDATIESSERNRRTKSAPSSHSFLSGSSRYFSANILDTVGSLTPRVAATLDWLIARARAARITAFVRTLRLSGAGCGEGLRCAIISLERIPLIYFRGKRLVSRYETAASERGAGRGAAAPGPW